MRMQLTAKQMMKGNQKGVNQGGGLLICMQMFQVYVTEFGDEFHCHDGDYLYDEFG